MTDNLDENFKAAVARMDRISKSSPDEDLFKKYGDPLVMLYGYYKVATVGPINKPKPGVFDIKGRKKWDAWDKATKLNMTTEQAKARYVQSVLCLIKE